MAQRFIRSIAVLFILFVLLIVGLIFRPPVFLNAAEQLKEALFYQKRDKGIVQCLLCPNTCVIPNGKRGVCGVRENQSGVLYAVSFGKLVSANDADPIEKKPFFHFLPGTKTFSVATAGCNMSCKFCQNWEISQRRPEELTYTYVTPEALVAQVKLSGRPTLAFTYTEPTVFYEYMLECARLAKQAGIRTVMHSNGYINEEPLRRLAKYLDAAVIDLKGFKEDYYQKVCGGSLAPVLAALKVLSQEGVHLEITTLILPGYNDDDDSLSRLCLWVKDNLGVQTPIHFSRFFPLYKLTSLSPTPAETLDHARKIALESGLQYVYIGNLAGTPAEETYCPRCKKIVIKRSGYMVSEIHIVEGKCVYCGERIEGVWQ